KWRIEWAEQMNIKDEYPAQYKNAKAAMTAAQMAYDNQKYVPAKTLAEEVCTILSDDFMAKVMADREQAAKAKAEAERLAQEKAAAEASLAKAQNRYDWAGAHNAANNYPELYQQGGSELAMAKQALEARDYKRAQALADQAYATLMKIGEFAPLPATYKVRLIPERRDCLWRIAEYPFVYNNPLKWPVLYEANKKTFRDPSNPDLIYPGQILVIPSIKGEERVGEWDPRKTYQPFAK
ncbi:MAG: hypothetical protein WHT81_05375, partial [Rectinemataceae bacterium]